jgi:hypothetical protein
MFSARCVVGRADVPPKYVLKLFTMRAAGAAAAPALQPLRTGRRPVLAIPMLCAKRSQL